MKMSKKKMDNNGEMEIFMIIVIFHLIRWFILVESIWSQIIVKFFIMIPVYVHWIFLKHEWMNFAPPKKYFLSINAVNLKCVLSSIEVFPVCVAKRFQ